MRVSPRWFVRVRPAADEAPLVLYCFPHAGGGAHAFQQWQHAMGADVEVRALQLPGRGARFSEVPCREFGALVDQLEIELANTGDPRPFAFFGHSLGALVAFELTHRLTERSKALPTRLFVSGAEGPEHPRQVAESLADAPDERLELALRDYDGSPAEVFENPELLSLVLPVFRADMALLRSYRYRRRPPLSTAITVLAGKHDPSVDLRRARDWRDESQRLCELLSFEGKHFFIDSARAEVTRVVRDYLTTRITKSAQ